MRKMQRRNAQPPKTAADHAIPLSPPLLAARYAAVRRATERLVEPLSPEDCALQSMPDASPAKWHLAHTSWFFETFVLERFVPDYRPFHPAYRTLFNSYYNAVGDKHPRPERGLISRPGLPDVLSCAGARARRRLRTYGTPTAISSRRKRAGNSAACAWRGTPETVI